MGITGNEVSAANQQRRNEELSKSPVSGFIESGIGIASGTATLVSSLSTDGSVALAIGSSIVAGLGIVDWFRKLGTSKVNENLEALGEATEDALDRVENVLKEHGTAIDEIKRRLVSNDLKEAMAGASLHALRTTQKERLKRLALILANGVELDDLKPESTDDMLRAAVELKDADLVLLGKIYASQNSALLLQVRQGESPDRWHGDIQSVWRAFANSGALNPQEHLSYRSSLARLESAGLIQRVDNVGTYGVGLDCYALLLEGKRFHERLQEIRGAK